VVNRIIARGGHGGRPMESRAGGTRCDVVAREGSRNSIQPLHQVEQPEALGGGGGSVDPRRILLPVGVCSR
jgi:hypothetical protein